MQLIYRGLAYNYKLNQVQLPSSMQTGIYRGQVFNTLSTVKVLRKFSPIFKYRGIEYGFNGDLPREETLRDLPSINDLTNSLDSSLELPTV